MDERLLNLVPTHYLCPFCGEWHKIDDMSGINTKNALRNWNRVRCSNGKGTLIWYYTCGEFVYDIEDFSCPITVINDEEERIKLSQIYENKLMADVQFRSIPYELDVGECQYGTSCFECNKKNKCYIREKCKKTSNPKIRFKLGFKFDKLEYEKIKLETLRNEEKDVKNKENDPKKNKIKENKEELTMSKTTKNGTTIKTLLYENSPKENLELMKIWAEKYKPVLRWAVPVAAVYAAYRILNSNECDLSVNNIAETCEKKLGFKIAFLENKKALKELMALGGISAGAYGAVQAISGFIGADKEKNEDSTDITVEDLEKGITQIESISKKFSFLQPKTENLLPIALSVILVYTVLHKPKFTGKFAKKVHVLTEDLQIKVSLYSDLAKSFIQDKFNIDLSDDEEQKKVKICVFLLGMIGVLAFLYGKKVLSNKSKSKTANETDNADFNKSVTAFIEQAKGIVEKLAPTVYTSLITLLVSKKLLSLEEGQTFMDETDNDGIME